MSPKFCTCQTKNNGDEQFWEEKLHVANGKLCGKFCGKVCMHSRCLVFFPFGLGWGREVFFHFLLFPMSFHQIPNRFPSRSQIVPHVLTMFLKHVPNNAFFYPTCKCCPPLTIDGWKGRNTTLLPFFYFGYFACAVLVTVFGSFSWTNQSTNYGINCTLSPTNPTN